MESSDSTASHCRQQQQRPRLNQGLNVTSWSASDTSQSTFPLAYPSMIQGFPLQVYPRTSSAAPDTNATSLGCSSDNQASQTLPGPSSIQPAPFPSPMVTPIVALVLPDYLYPPLASRMAPPPPVYHPPDAPGFPTQMHPFSGQFSFSAAPAPSVQNPFSSQHRFPSQASFLTPSVCFPPSTETPKAPAEGQSRSTTPGCGGPTSPPIFPSSCSSPLNLLELELSVDRQDSTALPPGGQGTSRAERENGAGGIQANDREPKQVTTVRFVQLPLTPPPLQISPLLLTFIFRKAVECKVLPEKFGWFELSEADDRVSLAPLGCSGSHAIGPRFPTLSTVQLQPCLLLILPMLCLES